MPSDGAKSRVPKGGRPGVGVQPTWERPAFIVLAIVAVVLGSIVLDRSAFSDRRRTDAGVFFRAGWAVRNGIDPYKVTDENDWYYLYPPGMAVFMVPLADPPAAEPLPAVKDFRLHARPPGYLPYPVSVVIWYALSVACMVLSVRWLCGALERTSSDPRVRAITPRWGGWWNLRFWPALAVLPDAASTLSRGQVNILLLAMICLGVDQLSRGRRVWAGAAWSLSACVKVFPGVLLLYLIPRRDWRALAGYAACGVGCMIVLPLIVFGPAKAVEHTWTFTQGVLLAGLGVADAVSLQAGAGPENTDNCAIQGVLHNLTNIGTPRGQRPKTIAPWIKLTHVGASAALLLATLMIGRGVRRWGATSPVVEPGRTLALRTGMLCCVMLAAVPMCHRHYMVLLYPAVAALVFVSMQRSTLALPTGAGLAAAVGLPIALAIPKATQSGLLRDLPIPLACTLALWTLCAIELARSARMNHAPTSGSAGG